MSRINTHLDPPRDACHLSLNKRRFASTQTMNRMVRTICQACHCECGVLVQVEDGRVTKVKGDPEHPMNRGFTCIKGRAQPQVLYHPNRLTCPMRRVGERGSGKWERVSWNTALEEIAAKLSALRDKYGPESFHAEGRQISSLRRRVPDPLVEIHPETARAEKIREGDWVWIETPQVQGERVKFKVKITDRAHPKIIHARHGWWFTEKASPEHGCFDSNVNVVLSDGPSREAICASVRTRGTLCKIYT